MSEVKPRKRGRPRGSTTNPTGIYQPYKKSSRVASNEQRKQTLEKQRKRQKKQARARHLNKLLSKVKAAPVYYPTEAEFEDPLAYIQHIQPSAELFGICKVVPPRSFIEREIINSDIGIDAAVKRMPQNLRFPTKSQRIDRLTSGRPYKDGKKYNISEYRAMADAFKQAYIGALNKSDKETLNKFGFEEVEKEYWRLLDITKTCDRKLGPTVEYGNDLDSDNFADNPREKMAASGWNLKHIPFLKNGLLELLPSGKDRKISGITTPWLYLGMLFSTFCWHVEDNWLYSINFSHVGAIKTWYGVPSTHAVDVELAIKEARRKSVRKRVRRKRGGSFDEFDEGYYDPVNDSESESEMSVIDEYSSSGEDSGEDEDDVIRDLTLMVSPKDLISAGVPVCTAHQSPGEFIVTFPRAFHGGFSHGFNIGEAVNFALPDWIPYGVAALQTYINPLPGQSPRASVLDHDRLMFAIGRSMHLEEPLLSKMWLSSELSYCGINLQFQPNDSAANALQSTGKLFVLRSLRNELARILSREDEWRNTFSYDSSNIHVCVLEDNVGKVNENSDLNISIAEDDQQLRDRRSCPIDSVTEEDEELESRICPYCNQSCYLSAMICSCNSSVASCLSHAAKLCQCPPSKAKWLLSWHTTDELRPVLQRVDDILEREECKLRSLMDT